MGKRAGSDSWRNRIVRYSDEDPKRLQDHPLNFRTHSATQAEALRGVLNDVGFVQNVIVNERTNRIIDGHLRVHEAAQAGMTRIPVTWVDLTDEEERLILATFDPLSSLAGIDGGALDNLLRGVSSDSPAIAAMLDDLAQEAGIVPEADDDDDMMIEPPLPPRSSPSPAQTNSEESMDDEPEEEKDDEPDAIGASDNEPENPEELEAVSDLDGKEIVRAEGPKAWRIGANHELVTDISDAQIMAWLQSTTPARLAVASIDLDRILRLCRQAGLAVIQDEV